MRHKGMIAVGMLSLLLMVNLLLHGASGETYVTSDTHHNGTDNKTCINGGRLKPCLTLSYVLRFLNNDNMKACNDEGGSWCNIVILSDQVLDLEKQILVAKNIRISGARNHSGRGFVTIETVYFHMKIYNSTNHTIMLTNLCLINNMLGSANYTPQYPTFSVIGSTKQYVGTALFENVTFLFTQENNLLSLNSMLIMTVQHLQIIRFEKCTFKSNLTNITISDPSISTLNYHNHTSLTNFQTLEFSGCAFEYYFNNVRSNTASYPLVTVIFIRIAAIIKQNKPNRVTIIDCTFNDGRVLDTAHFTFMYINLHDGGLKIEGSSFGNNTALFSHYIPATLTQLIGVQYSKPICYLSLVNTNFTNNSMFGLVNIRAQSNYLEHYSESNFFVFSIVSSQIMGNNGNKALITLRPHESPFILLPTNVTLATVELQNVYVVENSHKHDFYLSDQGLNSIVFLQQVNISITDSSFNRNTATPLSLKNVTVFLHGTIVFRSNTNPYQGGAVYFDHGDTAENNIIKGTNANVSFIENVARHGGAVYSYTCLQFQQIRSNLTFTFDDNAALDSVIYINQDSMTCDLTKLTQYVSVHRSDSRNGIPLLGSYPCNITLTPTPRDATITMPRQHQLDVYPGKEIVLNMNVTNCQGQDISCTADIFLFCGQNKPCNPKFIVIQGPSSLFIQTGMNINTGLKITASNKGLTNNRNNNLLAFVCTNVPATENTSMIGGKITVNLQECPIGLILSDMKCKCVEPPNYSRSFLCSAEQGIACIEVGYWFGPDTNNETIILPCPNNLNCKGVLKNATCPLALLGKNADPTKYTEVILSQDGLNNQLCEYNHGGLLCAYCSDNHTITYLAMQCIDSNLCRSWHPWVLLMVTVLLSFVSGTGMIYIVRTESSSGLGYLYGPLFYMVALTYVMPTATQPELMITVKAFTSLYLVQYEVLGYIPWCFFNAFTPPLYSVALRFLNPLIFSLILLTTILLAKCWPRVFLRLQPNPIHAMSVLLLVSLWLFAEISIELLLFTPVGNEFHPLLHPQIKYFTHGHIPLVIFAVFVQLVLGIFLLLLILSQFISFPQLKPFLDQFKSCYQDKYRWYSILYALAMVAMTPVSISGYEQVAKTVIVLATISQCIIQPYHKKWLNVVDTLLLADLTFIIFLHDDTTKSASIITWLLILIPLLYIFLGTVVLLVHGTSLYRPFQWIWKRLELKLEGQRFFEWSKRRLLINNRCNEELQQSASCIYDEREPLIKAIQKET